MSNSDDLEKMTIAQLQSEAQRLKYEKIARQLHGTAAERLERVLLLSEIQSYRFSELFSQTPGIGNSNEHELLNKATKLLAESLSNAENELQKLRTENDAMRAELHQLREESPAPEAPDLRLGALAWLVAKIGGNKFKNTDGSPNVNQIIEAIHSSFGTARGLGKSQFHKVLSGSVRLFSKHVRRQHAAKPESEPESD